MPIYTLIRLFHSFLLTDRSRIPLLSPIVLTISVFLDCNILLSISSIVFSLCLSLLFSSSVCPHEQSLKSAPFSFVLTAHFVNLCFSPFFVIPIFQLPLYFLSIVQVLHLYDSLFDSTIHK